MRAVPIESQKILTEAPSILQPIIVKTNNPPMDTSIAG